MKEPCSLDATQAGPQNTAMASPLMPKEKAKVSFVLALPKLLQGFA